MTLDETALAAATKGVDRYLADNLDDADQMSAAQFIANRSDLTAKAAVTAYLAALPVGEYGELVGRLRAVGKHEGSLPDLWDACDDAATAIERLVRERDEALRRVTQRIRDEVEIFHEGFATAHENAGCGHARANWRDPNYGTDNYRGEERCEFCDALTKARAEAERLRTSLEWALDTLDGNDKFIVAELGAECDQRIDAAAKAKARALLPPAG